MLTYELTHVKGRPLYEQLYAQIRQDIEAGRLKDGEQLPSKRGLAAHLKVSVITVEGAYEQLLAEGYIRSAPRRGYFVLPLILHTKSKDALSEKQELKEEQTAKPNSAFSYDFATNAVDPAGFPFSTWAKLMRQVLSEGGLLEATNPQGLYDLRHAIVRHLRAFRGMTARPEQIVVGAGSEYLTSLLVQLLGRDQGYAVENPGYTKIQQIFVQNGARVCAVPMDAFGIQIEALRKSGAQIAHVTPSHQFPLGIVMTVTRRMELLQWAAEQPGRYLIEDDYDSEFRFSGRPIPALQRLDAAERVIYMNTFAKSLAPSFRISYLVLPPHLAKRYQSEFQLYASTVPAFEQRALARFMEQGYFERHISRMRSRYKARRDALLQAVGQSDLAPVLSLSGGEAGLHLLLRVENGMGERELLCRASAQGVGVNGISSCYAPPVPPPASTLILGYARLSAERMADAVSALKRAWGQAAGSGA